ncbi:MAG: CBS domain-containing protein [Myxococcota bacterium]
MRRLGTIPAFVPVAEKERSAPKLSEVNKSAMQSTGDPMHETAASVMTNSVISVSPATSLLDVLRLFVEENVHGAPVIDVDGKIAGVVSTSDLLDAQEREQSAVLTRAHYLQEYIEFSGRASAEDLADFQDRLVNRSVAEVMTKNFISVPPNAPISAVARCLRKNQIHRVWVVEDDRVCGVISTLDLMPLLEEH